MQKYQFPNCVIMSGFRRSGHIWYVVYLLTSVLGGDMQNWIRPILAFSTLVTPPATCDAFKSNTSPSTSCVSSTVPLWTINEVLVRSSLTAHPSLVITLISLRSTLVATAGSITLNIASTVIGASWCEYCDTT